MMKSSHLDADGTRLVEQFPTRSYFTAEEAMASSSMAICASSSVFVMPSGVFTWVDDTGQWLHPEYGTSHSLSELVDPLLDDDGEPDLDALMPTEVATRCTTDDPFSDDNFGPWVWSDGDDVAVVTVSAQPAPLLFR